MNIAVFGATGDTGRRFCRRALDATHSVVGFSFRRTEIEGVDELRSTPIALDDEAAVLAALDGVDAIVSAIGGDKSTRSSGIDRLVRGAQKQGIQRIVAIGGAGILATPSGGLLKDQPFFPDFLVPISDAHQDAWKVLEASGLQWTLICPGTMRDGVSNGRYRSQADTTLPDMKGILYDDVAHLILECLERDLYVQQRVSVSNP